MSVPLILHALLLAAERRRLLDAASMAQVIERARGAAIASVADLAAWLHDQREDHLCAAITPLLAPPNAEPCGNYRLLAHLADGGMGAVWLATSDDHDLVVIKTGRPMPGLAAASVARLQRRFARESAVTASLDHPNIIRSLGSGCTPSGQLWLALEFLPGGDVERMVEVSGAVPETVALHLLREMSQALAVTHRAGLVHRDLKPSNLYLGRGGVVKIADFGIARLDDGEALTRSGSTLGSPAWMAPEQIGSTTAIDIRADIYACGCVLWYLLSGRPPYVGRPHELLRQHVESPPPDPVAAGLNLTPATAALITACMTKDPARRLADPEDLRASTTLALAQARDRGGPDPVSWLEAAISADTVPLVATPDHSTPVSLTYRQSGPIRFREPETLAADRQRNLRAASGASQPAAAERSTQGTAPLRRPSTDQDPIQALSSHSQITTAWLALTVAGDGARPQVHCWAQTELILGKLARPPVHVTTINYPIAVHAAACHRISRSHCRLAAHSRGIEVWDLDTANGCQLNGTAIRTGQPVGLPLDRLSRLVLADVVHFDLQPIVKRAGAPGDDLPDGPVEAVIISRPLNRSELSYALVRRRLRIGGPGADVVLPGAQAGADLELAFRSGAWWSRSATETTWQPVAIDEMLSAGGLSLRALPGEHRLLV